MKKIAAITIGQSPRLDIMSDLTSMLPEDLCFQEYGALDPYSLSDVRALFSPTGREEVLVSRMRDGTEVRLSEQKICTLLQKTIGTAEADGSDAVLLLCTGAFPAFSHTVPLLLPQPILHANAHILADGAKIAVMVPDEAQISDTICRWEKTGLKTEIVVASPYSDMTQIQKAACMLQGSDAAFLVMDCMGYSCAMKKIAGEYSRLSVLLPRTLIASIVIQFLSAH